MNERIKALIPELVERHRVIDIDRLTWFRVPAKVRILMYAEGSIRFTGGSFHGLDRVRATLLSDPWPWVKFEVTTAHRGTDPSANLQNRALDEVDLESYDELWLFGIAGGNLLSQAEIDAVHAFMDAGGGVLHTGDHASLGEGIAGALKRAGEMRQYPAPAAAPGVWNSTLRDGGDGVYQFNDQSDDTPQPIRLRTYLSWSYSPSLVLSRKPHPVMCGQSGPIRIFPDHQHEGEAIAPANYPAATWPSKNGFQPKVEVVAWGKIEDPSADVGREVGLVSVYDGHRADVGRIVADSTWHHWFDINLDGFAATPTGQAHLDKIEEYFLNVAAWLAPQAKQKGMRNGVVLIASWHDPLVMLDKKAFHPWALGTTAVDALGQFAPQCLVRWWITDLIPRIQELEVFEPLPGPGPSARFPLPVEEYVLARALQPILERNLKVGAPEEAGELDFVEDVVDHTVSRALDELVDFGKKMGPVIKEVARFEAV